MPANKASLAAIVFAYLVVYIVWGSTFFFIEVALRSFPTFVLGSIRFIIAGGLLITYCWLRGYKLFEWESVRFAMLIGFLLLFVDMAAIIWSEQYISSAIVSILSAATAIWFVLFDKPKWRVNFRSATIMAGVFMGFAGVIMLFVEQIFTAEAGEQSRQKLIAMIVMILGTIGWTIGSLLSKYFQEKKNKKKNNKAKDSLNVIVKTAWQMITAGVAFTITALLNGEYRTFNYKEVLPQDWGAMIYLATMGSILAFSCYIWLLQVRPATEVSTYAYINPIVALLLAHFFTDHVVTKLQITGLLIVLFSVLLMNWNLYKNNRTFRIIRARKKLKRLRHMAPKSSIPRIIEVAEFDDKEKSKNHA